MGIRAVLRRRLAAGCCGRSGQQPGIQPPVLEKFRKAVKEANPEAVILAENYGDSYDWLQGDEWDTIMNYDAFMEPVTWFLTGMQKHSDEFRQDMLGNAGNFSGRCITICPVWVDRQLRFP